MAEGIRAALAWRAGRGVESGLGSGSRWRWRGRREPEEDYGMRGEAHPLYTSIVIGKEWAEGVVRYL